MKKKFVYGILLSLLASNVIAKTDWPAQCPDVAKIKQIFNKDHLQEVYTGNWWVFIPRNRFGTKDCWYFSTENFSAADKDQAYQAVKTKLNTMYLVNGPARQEPNFFYCTYYDKDQNRALAVFRESELCS